MTAKNITINKLSMVEHCASRLNKNGKDQLTLLGKNIPTASNNTYKTQLIAKIEAVIKRMRWKAIFFENDDDGGGNCHFFHMWDTRIYIPSYN